MSLLRIQIHLSIYPLDIDMPALSYRGKNSSNHGLLMVLFTLCVYFSMQTCTFSTQTSHGQDPPVIRSVGNSFGFREHRIGLWSFINPVIANPTNSDQQLEVVAFFQVAQNKKFAKRIIIPSRSVLRINLPIQIPPLELIPKREESGLPHQSIRIQVQLYDVSDNEPRLILNEGKRSYDTDIGLRNISYIEGGDKYRSTSAIQSSVSSKDLSAQETADDDSPGDDSEEMVTATRIYFNQVGRIGKSTTKFLPDSQRAFDSVDQLIINNDHLLHDEGGLASVRRWLARGGNLWIMLDLVSPETVARILGDSTPFQLIDRTSLTTIQIVDADPNSKAAPPEPSQFEDPVDFARVVLTRGTLTHNLDGWPASFWIKSGQGRVYFTTVGARGWMRKLDPRTDSRPDLRLGITQYTVTDPLEQIGFEMYAQQDVSSSELDYTAIKTHLIDQIGYRVLGRSTVVAILASQAALLIGFGIWFSRRQMLEKLFFVGPVLAIVTAAIFYFVGVSNQQAAPSSVASFQVVEPIPGGNELRVDGMSVMYSQEDMDFPLNGNNDGVINRDTEESTDSETKLLWDESGNWTDVNGKIEPGLVAYRISSNVVDTNPVKAAASFSDQGLAGRIEGQLNEGGLNDLVLALPNGKFFSVELESDQASFTLNENNILSPNQFVRGNLLSDKQRWHESVYKTQFPPSDLEKRVSNPTLFGWSSPLSVDIQFPETFQKRGGALVKIPFEIVRSAPDTSIKIPSPMIAIENAINSRNAISGCFDDKTGIWMGSIAEESTTRIRFQIPSQVLPLKLESATLKIGSIQGLNRIIQIKTANGQAGQLIQDFDDFNGRFEKVITDPNWLTLDDQGGFSIDIDIKVKPEFYERQKQQEQRNEVDADGTPKKLELNREELKAISLEVEGTTLSPGE